VDDAYSLALYFNLSWEDLLVHQLLSATAVPLPQDCLARFTVETLMTLQTYCSSKLFS